MTKHYNYCHKFTFTERTSCDKVRAKLLREMNMAQLVIGIVGMLCIIGVNYVPSTSIYFDTISVLFVIGVASFYVLAVGGNTIQKISRFGKAALHAATLGFFIGLAGIAAMDDPPVAAHQVAIFVLVFGYVIYFVCSAIVERYENEGND